MLWLQCETRISAELVGAFFTLFFAWNVVQHVRTARSETKHSNAPTFKSINEAHALTIEHSVFSIMAGLIVEILFVLFSVFITLHNGLKMSKYEAYWLMGFLLINS